MDNLNRFDEIEHLPLRVYNRVVMTHNLLEDSGEDAVRAYLDQFTDDERKQMFIVNTYLTHKGQKATYDYVTKDLEIQYNSYDEDYSPETVTVH